MFNGKIIMKNLILIFTSIILISSCAENQMEAQDSSPPALVEYVWHKAGPEFSSDNLAMLVTSWNDMIDSMQCGGMQGANILTPEVGNIGYDFIWVMLWNSQESRDKCWDDWTTNHQSKWDIMIDGIMQYDLDNTYLFGWTIRQMPKVESNSGQFVNSFNFCNYNEGFSSTSLENHINNIVSIDWSDSFWFGLLDPKFEPADPKPDFVWLNLWANIKEKNIAQAKYYESDLPSTSGTAFTCNNVDFSGVAIRR